MKNKTESIVWEEMWKQIKEVREELERLRQRKQRIALNDPNKSKK